ncbi:MAG: Gfo/Idh/MocA family oxidoreductase [Candidatus Poribacteria bacterium]|nr:Gfo/Idh/MocA family oxidoreductase [Candidatus Poribacteria bacterium]
MNTKIGIGIISFAHGHANAYCNKMQTFDDVKLVACWDDNVERGENAATQYGMTFSPHLEDVVNHPEIDAVIVTCETNRHAEMVVAAASEGKHILCQKPMALTLADCDKIADAVQKSGVKFMMAHQMRRDPANIAMKELIESGVLGKIGLLRRRHCINVLFNEAFVTGPSRWHIDPVKNMGMFMDDASHATDFIYWMLGKPTSVIAEIDNVLTDVAPDDTGVAVYRFSDGAMAILINTSVTLAGENTTEIYGHEGVVIQNYGDGPSCNMPRPEDAIALKLYTREEPSWKDLGIAIPNSHGERIAGVPRPFIDCLKSDSEPDVSVEAGRVSVEMVLGAYRSAQDGRRVKFPL